MDGCKGQKLGKLLRAAAFLAGRVVREGYYSRLSVTLVCTRAMQAIICTAGPYASHDLARKNAKFTMKLSTTRHVALGRCGESR